MNKVILAFSIVIMLVGCADKKEKKTEEFISTDVVVASESEEPIIASEFKKGEELIAASDCLACHKVNEKVIGPSYQDVANKYSSKDEVLLVSTIINGGSGNWGEIPMTAHATLAKDDALEMVKYILSLKK